MVYIIIWSDDIKNFRMYREAPSTESPSNMDDIGQYEIDIIIRYIN